MHFRLNARMGLSKTDRKDRMIVLIPQGVGVGRRRILITHKITLEDGPDADTMVQEKTEGCIKVVINP